MSNPNSNYVLLNGKITRSTWGKTKKSGFFITIWQERKLNEFTNGTYFTAFANEPLATTLAERVKQHPNAQIKFDGELWTYYNKRHNTFMVSIRIINILEFDNQKI
jgi:hypothetical protein